MLGRWILERVSGAAAGPAEKRQALRMQMIRDAILPAREVGLSPPLLMLSCHIQHRDSLAITHRSTDNITQTLPIRLGCCRKADESCLRPQKRPFAALPDHGPRFLALCHPFLKKWIFWYAATPRTSSELRARARRGLGAHRGGRGPDLSSLGCSRYSRYRENEGAVARHSATAHGLGTTKRRAQY